MITQAKPAGVAPFRIWMPSDEESEFSGISPGMTLRQFFEEWFAPIVLVGDRDSAEGTLTIYRNAIDWWERLTGDPPIGSIDEFTIATFKQAMRGATYKRSPLGRSYPLSRQTQHKHLRQIRAILYRLGPTTDPNRPAKGVLPAAPHITVGRAEKCTPKRPFEIDLARRLYASAVDLRWGRSRGGVVTPETTCCLAMRAFCSLLYYTGIRSGTALGLEWSHVRIEGREVWLDIPSELVHKTHKGISKFVHRALLRDLQRARCGSRLIPWPYSYTHLDDQHDRLQELAGVPEPLRLSPQAWRRTHGTEMAKVGAEAAMKVAQHALDHGDEATTRQFYVSIEPTFIKKLPPLCDEPEIDDERQRRLF